MWLLFCILSFIGKIYQTLKTVLSHIFKHLELEFVKNAPLHASYFNFFLACWKRGQTGTVSSCLCFMFSTHRYIDMYFLRFLDVKTCSLSGYTMEVLSNFRCDELIIELERSG